MYREKNRLMFFTYLLRLLLIWWIVSILFKWVGKFINAPQNSAQATHHESREKTPDVVHSGKIEDADFEEIDGR